MSDAERATSGADDRERVVEFVDAGHVGELVTEHELAELSDLELVRLIQIRSSLDEERAREALVIIRDEIPEDTTFER